MLHPPIERLELVCALTNILVCLGLVDVLEVAEPLFKVELLLCSIAKLLD